MKAPATRGDLSWRSTFAVLLGVVGAAAVHALAWTWPLPVRTEVKAEEHEPPKKGPPKKGPPEKGPQEKEAEKKKADTRAFHVTLRPEDFGRREESDAAHEETAGKADAAAPARAEPAPKPAAAAAESAASAPPASLAPVPVPAAAGDEARTEAPADAEGAARSSPPPPTSTAPAFPALVLSWPDLAAVESAITHHGFALAGIRGDKIVCAIRLTPAPHTEPWSASLAAFSVRARELPATLLAPELRAASLEGAWLLVPVEVERAFELAIRTDLARRGLAPEQVGAVYARLDTASGEPRLRIERVVTRAW